MFHFVESAQDFTRAAFKNHHQRRASNARKAARQKAEARLSELQNAEPSAKAIAEALAQEEMMVIHHNHEFALMQ